MKLFVLLQDMKMIYNNVFLIKIKDYNEDLILFIKQKNIMILI